MTPAEQKEVLETRRNLPTWLAQTVSDALGVAATASGRPASLSKGYGVIRRFSEDVDMTYDIRALLPDETGGEGEAIPRRCDRR